MELPNSNEPSPNPRTPLTRERVLAAAVVLADSSGIASLTMRTLGEAVGVEAMSLYNHVANKDDLLNGMVDAIFSQIELPSADVDWKAGMRQRAISAREVLTGHPWAIGLMSSRTSPGPATLRHHDAVIGALRRNGFSVTMTAHAFSAIDSYIYGFALQQTTLPFDTPDESAELAQEMFAQMPTDQYSYLTEFAQEHVLQPGYNYSDEFEFGLDLILDGLEKVRDRQ